MNKSDLSTAVHLVACTQLRKEVCDECGMNELVVDFCPTGYGGMAFCLGEEEKAGLGGRRKYLEFTENVFELDFGI